jgi:hypothetical protein
LQYHPGMVRRFGRLKIKQFIRTVESKKAAKRIRLIYFIYTTDGCCCLLI